MNADKSYAWHILETGDKEDEETPHARDSQPTSIGMSSTYSILFTDTV